MEKESLLAGKKGLVVGLGKSGTAAAQLLKRLGAEVIATDRSPPEQLSESARKLDAQLYLGSHEGVPWTAVDLIVVSPGVPNMTELRQAERAGVEVIGETELAARFLSVPLCAVGGTNGKSTVTVLLGHLLEAMGKHTFVGGNLGRPACEAPGAPVDIALLEVSSFQMERVNEFRPRAAVLLNITEDHLDRYDSFQSYAHAKGNCFRNQLEEDFAIFPNGSEACRRQVSRGRGRHVTFGADGDYFLSDVCVVERETGTRFDLSEADLHGRHNYENAAAAIAVARALGATQKQVAAGLADFRALPHRMALAGKHAGIAYYDDSKATNVGSAVTALLGLAEEKGVLIAGGRDKMGSYLPLIAALREKGRAAVLIGEAAERLSSAIGDAVPVFHADTMREAVERASRVAREGDAVLLSPACSSFDMFKNYSDRGERFTEAVEALSSSLGE